MTFFTNSTSTTGISGIADIVTQSYSAKSYMQGVMNVLQNPTSVDPSIIFNCYQFLHAMETGTNFTATMTPDGKPISPQSFNFAFLTDDQKQKLKEKSDALFKTYSAMVQNPNVDPNATVFNLNLINQATGQPATLYDLLANPTGTFTVAAYCWGNINSNVNWCHDLYNYYLDTDGSGAGNDMSLNGNTSSHGQDSQIAPGISIEIECHHSDNGCDNSGGGTTFNVSGSGSAWESLTRIQTMNPQDSKNDEADLAQFLNENM